jgi:hypothetical protein
MDVRLFINKRNRRVLYAEAGKDFVDLLFGFLLLPTGGVIRLLREHGSTSSKSVASISNLYKSVDKLNATYMTTEKTFWLKPHKSFICYNGSPRIEYAIPPIYYACGNANRDFDSKHQLSTRAGQRCVCGHELTNQLHFLDHPSSYFSSSSANPDQMIPGFVKETVTFIITDDLNILPISTITRIILLNQLEVKDLSELEEITVTVGPDKALELLWASMASTTVLNDAFSPVILNNFSRGKRRANWIHKIMEKMSIFFRIASLYKMHM